MALVEDPASVEDTAEAAAQRAGYGRGAKLMAIGLAATGVMTFAYFSLASYALGDVDYKHVSLLWSIMFTVCSVIYRPVEQLLARTIATRRARGLTHDDPLKTPMLIQASFALGFLVLALALHGPLVNDLFDGASALYWLLIVGVLAYAASYFARGWLAGSQKFALYGGLVFCESTSRVLFATAVIVGVASGQTAVACGMAAAPFLSLIVVPWAFKRRATEAPVAVKPAKDDGLSLARGGRFAVAVLAIMAAEQTLINASVLIINATTTDKAIAGFVFNALLIARAPLQLFQAIQGSLLPHLASLDATDGSKEFSKAIRMTVLAIVAFAGAVAIGLLLLGPFAMDILFKDDFTYGRWGLALVAVGMGLHLCGGTLNQAALARDRAGSAALCWIAAAVAFVVLLIAPLIGDRLVRAEFAYFAAAGLLCGLLTVVYKRGAAKPGPSPA